MAPTNPHDHTHDHDAFHAQHGHAEHDGLYNEDVAHEHSDVNVRALVTFCVALAVITGVVMLAMYGLFNVFESQAKKNDPVLSPHAMPADQTPPEPVLLTDEPLNLQRIRGAEDQVLQGYGWIDQAAGVARLPIDEAKKKLLQDGLPVRPDAPEDPMLGTILPARGESSSGRFITAKPGQPGEQPAPAPPGEPKAEPAPAPHKGGH